MADNFAADEEIAHVTHRAAAIAAATPAGIIVSRDATGLAFEMPVDGDSVLTGLASAVHAALGFGNVHGQTMRVRRYAAGNSHPAHCDVFEIDGAFLVATTIIYLDDADGGETYFPHATLSIEARRGRLAVWFNYTADGSEDESARHAGLAVRSGCKTTITSFVYNDIAVCGSSH